MAMYHRELFVCAKDCQKAISQCPIMQNYDELDKLYRQIKACNVTKNQPTNCK